MITHTVVTHLTEAVMEVLINHFHNSYHPAYVIGISFMIICIMLMYIIAYIQELPTYELAPYHVRMDSIMKNNKELKLPFVKDLSFRLRGPPTIEEMEDLYNRSQDDIYLYSILVELERYRKIDELENTQLNTEVVFKEDEQTIVNN